MLPNYVTFDYEDSVMLGDILGVKFYSGNADIKFGEISIEIVTVIFGKSNFFCNICVCVCVCK
jgi:hypothetical protein